MKFLCDNCQAQYMIADEKVGAAGVRVRCKKCSHVIFVKRTEEEAPTQDSTVVVSQEKIAQLSASSAAADPSPVSAASASDPPVSLGSEAVPGLEDEIGQALDSMFSDTKSPAPGASPNSSGGSRPPVVLGPSPLSRSPVSPFGSRVSAASTDALNFDPPELTQIASPATSGGNNSPPPGAPKTTEWFIAVQDEQVGPLTVDEIKGRFEKGEVGSDTLVWSTGLTDWRPLSNVEELAELIMPKKEIVRISRLPIPAEPPKESPKKDPIAFRPSAASALASLASMAKEELAASERPAPALARPPDPSSARSMEAVPSQFLAGLPPLGPSSTAIPVAEAPSADHSPAPSLGDYRSSPLAQSKPRRKGGSRTLTVAGGILGIGLLLGAIAAASYIFLIKPQRDLEARLEQQQRQDAQHLKEEDKARQDALAAAQAATAAAQKVVAPAPAPPPVPPQPLARAAPPEPASRQDSAHDKRSSKHGKGGKAGNEVPAVAAPPHPAPREQPPTKAAGNDDLLAAGDVDKEFAKELEGGDSKPAKHGPYIPPPPGQGDLPVSLSQSDIVGAVTQHRDAFAKCVQDQKRRDPSATGTVVMRWRIRPDGRSTDIAAKGEDYADSPLAGCFKSQIGKLRFGAYRGAQMAPIEFPFSF